MGQSPPQPLSRCGALHTLLLDDSGKNNSSPISNLQDLVPKMSSSLCQEALRRPCVQVVAPGLGCGEQTGQLLPIWNPHRLVMPLRPVPPNPSTDGWCPWALDWRLGDYTVCLPGQLLPDPEDSTSPLDLLGKKEG